MTLSPAAQLLQDIRDAADTVNDTLDLFTDDPHIQGRAALRLLQIESNIKSLETLLEVK